jgi:hypothetical protein
VQERLRIHHGVGSRVLLDSNQDQIPYRYEESDAGWDFYLTIDEGPILNEVLRLKDEINLFIFKDNERGATVEKQWFYKGNGEVSYQPETKVLFIRATRSIIYHPGDFESL